MPGRDWVVLKPYAVLVAVVFAVFLAGSFAIDAAWPAGTRDAVVLTLPTAAGDLVTDWALTIYQAIVLGGGIAVGAVMGRRRAER